MSTQWSGEMARVFSNWLTRFAVVGAMLLPVSGCAEEARESAHTDGVAPAASPPAAGEKDKSPGTDVPPALPRKIIYNAEITLVVESVTTVSDQITKLVKDAGGYISETDLASHAQTQRRATWKVRVPVDRFDTFLAAVTRLGEVERHHVDSQDVTQEYYDTEARIANKQQEEKRLLKHLADSTGKLEDILAVEKELSWVRGEIEQIQGRLKYLASFSALSTVTITATEVPDYTWPAAPTFAKRVERTFQMSLAQLAEFGRGFVLFVVALAPWLPVIAVIALPVWLLIRRSARTRSGPRTP